MIDKENLSMSLLNDNEMSHVQGGETYPQCNSYGDAITKICNEKQDYIVVRQCAYYESKCSAGYVYDSKDDTIHCLEHVLTLKDK